MISIIASSAPGLSPLARGTLYTRILCAVDRRFIPAGAGNTTNRPSSRLLQPVYPRWRGEHLMMPPSDKNAAGLSPLARGTPTCRDGCQQITRFIPAGAGNTHPNTSPNRDRTVYPRWRGEHDRLLQRQSLPVGLSPLARGTH